MNKLLNIAEILQDCPKGTELYSTICGKCFLSKIYPHLGIDVISEDNITYNFLYDGRFTIMGECTLFPSKDQRNWSKWQRPFMDGDILVSITDKIFIFSGTKIESFSNISYCTCHIVVDKINKNIVNCNFNYFGPYVSLCRYATEEEKQLLFDVIENNGYKWNSETKTLETIIKPKFKVGDSIISKQCPISIYTITGVTSEYYSFSFNGCVEVLPVKDQDDFELIEKKTFDFGKALSLLKEGKLVSRQGWNGKNMFVFMRPSNNLSNDFITEKVKSLPKSFKDFIKKYPFKDNDVKFNSYLCLKSANDEIINGWFASQTDMLAEDWFEMIP